MGKIFIRSGNVGEIDRQPKVLVVDDNPKLGRTLSDPTGEECISPSNRILPDKT